MKDLKNGSLDAIMAGVLGSDSEIESIPASTQSAVLLVNEKSKFASRHTVSLDELVGIPIVTYQNKRGPFAFEIAKLLSGHQHLSVHYGYNDEITLASLVTADPNTVAIACHSWLIGSFSDVVPIPIAEAPKDFHQFYISYRKRNRLPLVLEDFVLFMKQYDFMNVSPHCEEEILLPSAN